MGCDSQRILPEMKMDLFENRPSLGTKRNAQHNLAGRTHYVDDDSLRFHYSRILSCHVTDNGLLFGLVESVALDPNNTRRGYRPVIFDIAGRVVNERPSLDTCFKSKAQAEKAMWEDFNRLDAKALAVAAVDNWERQNAREAERIRELIEQAGK